MCLRQIQLCVLFIAILAWGRPCTVADDCNGASHAVSASGDTTSPTGCSCVCRNRFAQPNCATCPAPYTGSECNLCMAGYSVDISNGRCVKDCTIADNCTDHATAVKGTEDGRCVCTCRSNWEGDTCSTCPVEYTESSDCLACNTRTYVSYTPGPTCALRCTARSNCTNHASNVSGDSRVGCSCTCDASWSGDKCQTCESMFNESTGCQSCADGFDGYPTCSRLCTFSDCHNHATAVSGNIQDGCTCTCDGSNLNATNACGSCNSGFGNYPTCERFCTLAADCGPGAISVSGFDGACRCACDNRWDGDKCETCPHPYNATADCDACLDGYIDYPSCFLLCTSSANCSGHAVSVTGDSRTGCSCTCNNSWTDASCSTCAVQFGGSDCQKCADGYQGPYPNCVRLCTNVDDCSGHASKVTGMTGNCSCTCNASWSGDRCQTCEARFNESTGCDTCANGFDGYPNCSRLCTLSDCHNHATAVSGNTLDGCVCTCDGPNLNATNTCGSCNSGFGDYPTCQRFCTLKADCGEGASAVSGFDGACRCTCDNRWNGDKCDVCPHPYNATANCGACLNDYTDYPSCFLRCTPSANCSGHAVNVTGDSRTGCSCTCNNSWTDASCSTCDVQFGGSDCEKCADGYQGPYPNCVRLCTNVDDCSGHASNVSGTIENCSCICEASWSGSRCQTCETRFNESTGCQSCADGYDGYPDCSRLCTLSDCNDHATAVSGHTLGGCVCTCRNSWNGSTCASCADKFNTTDDCGACAADYDRYPICALRCTNATNCNSHARNVTGDVEIGCSCDCDNAWIGETCGTCPPGFDTNVSSCASCDVGFSGYPNCALSCTEFSNCSNHAVSVTGNSLTGCSCRCRAQWFGPRCESCPPTVNASDDCSTCLAGYDSLPGCDLTCTMNSNCSGHAVNVTGNSRTGCACGCRHEWFGDACENCPAFTDVNKDCGECVAGYGGYPNCRRFCTIADDCDGHATDVSGFDGACVCQCQNRWSLANCSVCPARFDVAANCDLCAPGYSGLFPNCSKKCTSRDDCSNNAATVSGDTLTGCTCKCRNGWSGPTCAVCPPNFDEASACGACAAGFQNYPLCQAACTTGADCTSNAFAVSGFRPNCTCSCRNLWTGNDCSVCDSKYSQASDCAACSDSRVLFPECFLACTTSANCSGHGVSVVGHSGTGCTCGCRNAWTGPTCAVCPQNITGSDCDHCEDGFSGYPNCTRTCTIAADCHVQNTATVSGRDPTCECHCKNAYTGSTCAVCPSNFDVTTECSSCSVGFVHYPRCDRQCTNARDCSNNAANVSGDLGVGCQCQCRNQWTGSDCSVCADRFSSGDDCAACAPGFVQYPACIFLCTSAQNCSGHAISVSGSDVTGCQCECQHSWRGDDCSVCPSRYDATTCDSCAAGYIGAYPDTCSRSCSVVDDCSPNAVSATGTTAVGCTCHCAERWAGKRCDKCAVAFDSVELNCTTCAAGYGVYPNCVRPCSISDDCSGHANSVQGTSATGCVCQCQNSWSGADCSICPPQFNSSHGRQCDACAEGTTGDYPACDRPCTIEDCGMPMKAPTTSGSSNDRSSGSSDTANSSSSNDSDDSTVGPTVRRVRVLSQGDDVGGVDTSHVVSVSGSILLGCHCSCSPGWGGPPSPPATPRPTSTEKNPASSTSTASTSRPTSCSTCAEYVTGENCTTCIEGFTGFPNCDRPCDLAQDCAGITHSVVARGTVRSGCQCECRGGWTGPHCTICPSPQFDQNCTQCAAGYIGFPQCYRNCTVSLDCMKHAARVTGNTLSSCLCECTPGWSGPHCDRCSDGVGGVQCDTCAPGYTVSGSFPSCTRVCTALQDCSNHATSVSGTTIDGCDCQCRNGWSGPSCAQCTPQFAGSDCNECAVGFGETTAAAFPKCTRPCDVNLDCGGSARAITVVGSTSRRFHSHGDPSPGSEFHHACLCTCRAPFTGRACESCAVGFVGETCGSCATHFSGYPTCSRPCSVTEDCSGRAVSVSGNSVSGCKCTCQSRWSGSACESCPSKFNRAEQCASCFAARTERFPICSNATKPSPGDEPPMPQSVPSSWRCAESIECSHLRNPPSAALNSTLLTSPGSSPSSYRPRPASWDMEEGANGGGTPTPQSATKYVSPSDQWNVGGSCCGSFSATITATLRLPVATAEATIVALMRQSTCTCACWGVVSLAPIVNTTEQQPQQQPLGSTSVETPGTSEFLMSLRVSGDVAENAALQLSCLRAGILNGTTAEVNEAPTSDDDPDSQTEVDRTYGPNKWTFEQWRAWCTAMPSDTVCACSTVICRLPLTAAVPASSADMNANLVSDSPTPWQCSRFYRADFWWQYWCAWGTMNATTTAALRAEPGAVLSVQFGGGTTSVSLSALTPSESQTNTNPTKSSSMSVSEELPVYHPSANDGTVLGVEERVFWIGVAALLLVLILILTTVLCVVRLCRDKHRQDLGGRSRRALFDVDEDSAIGGAALTMVPQAHSFDNDNGNADDDFGPDSDEDGHAVNQQHGPAGRGTAAGLSRGRPAEIGHGDFSDIDDDDLGDDLDGGDLDDYELFMSGLGDGGAAGDEEEELNLDDFLGDDDDGGDDLSDIVGDSSPPRPHQEENSVVDTNDI